MKISIITVFPELFTEFLSTSLIKRAQDSGHLSFQIISFSELCAPKERIDSPSCGPGAGMLIKPEVVERAIEKAESTFGKGVRFFFSPQGKKLDQNLLKHYYQTYCASTDGKASEQDPVDTDKQNHIILICSRYEGIDARVEQHYANEVISIGDYVLMGGDLPAQVFLEGFLRLMPGIVGKSESVEEESFSGPFLDHPEYTLPIEWHGMKVPDIVVSGNHEKIKEWRQEEAAKKTVVKRFDWLRAQPMGEKQKQLVRSIIPSHYVVLMHADVLVRDGNKVGTTSITSIDLHDISRSSATYDLKKFFVLSSLEDQHLIMKTFLSFWQSDEGREYNKTRYDATSRIVPVRTLEEISTFIEKKDGAKPLLIATSAQNYDDAPSVIGYDDHEEVWQHNRPVLLILGTGQGLNPELVERCDYILKPLEGFSGYKHLSVRSAAAIIFDRWLGLKS